jgi:hypothetical protein
MAVERRLWPAQIAFTLAVLCKETAVITPLALAVWEILDKKNGSVAERLSRVAIFLVPLLPLLGWLAYHYRHTGSIFGSRDFFQYNVRQTLNPLRFVLALGLRLWDLLGAMNMLALTAATAAAMLFPPLVDQGIERKRIAVPVQLQFALIMLAHCVAFALVGGAVLKRYLLPAYPLAIIIGMSTLHRRILRWQWAAAGIVVLFIMALFFDPPYRIAPEDNLRYRDFVYLHYGAARFLDQHERDRTILTAWPAQDELTKPYLGYVSQPLSIFQVRDFTVEEIMKARQSVEHYQAAYVFSTKYESNSWFRPRFWERWNRRFFDYHQDISPEAAAELLNGSIVYLARHKAEWVAIMEIDQPSRVALARTRNGRN